MSSIQQQKLEQCEQVSKEMLELALTGQWDRIAAQQEIREGLLNSVFSTTFSAETDSTRDVIQKIVDINAQIAELLTGYKNDLQTDVKKMKQGKQAVKAYDAF